MTEPAAAPRDDLPTLEELPAAVLPRLVVLTAQVLPDVPRLPPSLRKVSTFAVARRARHGAPAIVAALDDDEFRESVGLLVAARDGADAAPADLAARLWLTRPDDGGAALSAALAALDAAGVDPAASDRVRRLRDQVAALQAAEREKRVRHKAALEKVKGENVDLRRKLGEARAAERATRERAKALAEELTAARAAIASTTSSAEADARRWRAQAEELQGVVARGRRDARADRDDASMRARLLLDTVLEAAAGLQRELGLPAAVGAPADRVEVPNAEEGVRTPTSALASSSPAVLDQLLALPRAHLVVDGYNVSKTGWPQASLEVQRTRLLTGLASTVARTRCEVTVVFDAAAGGPRPVVPTPRGVRVVFSPEGVIADDVIRDYVAAEPRGRVVVVVTSDRELAAGVVRQSARVVTAAALVGLLSR
jgi:predicted RNA-binding protein with PIN domain